MINDVFSESKGLSKAAPSARSIYVALCEIASDKHRDGNLDPSQAEIAARAAVSLATVKRLLPILKKLGLVNIERRFEHGMERPSTYTIIRGELPIAHKELALAHEAKIQRATEKELKNNKKIRHVTNPKGVNTGTATSLADEDEDLSEKPW